MTVVCMYSDSIVTGTTTVLRDYPQDVFNHVSLHSRIRFMCGICCSFRRLPATAFAFELQLKPHVSAYTASRGTNLKFPISSARPRVPHTVAQTFLPSDGKVRLV